MHLTLWKLKCCFNKPHCFVLFSGKNLDKDILKQLFITAVAETEEQTAPGKDQDCPSH